MKKFFAAACLAVMLQSCFTIVIEDTTAGEEEMPDYLKPSGDITVVTGIAYPEDVDWTASGLDNPQARVVMYMDRDLKVNLSVSDAARVACCEPDQHFFSGGHLYSVFLSGEDTTLSRDGTPVLELEGRKFLIAVRDDGERLRTVWENEGGKGLLSLEDGKVLYSDGEACIFRNTGEDGEGNICFFYSVPVKSSSGMITQYYCVCGKDAIQMDLPKELDPIFGFIRSPDGFKVLCRNGGNRLCFEMYDTATGNSMLLLPPVSGGLAAISNDFPALFHACVTHPVRGTEWNVIFLDGLQTASWETDDLPVGFVRIDGGAAGVRKSRHPEGRDILVRGTVCDTLPPGYTVMTDAAVHISASGSARIGLSSKSGGKALLWSDGNIDTLGFRGVVTGIYVQERDREEEAETVRTTLPTENQDHIFTPR
ncbi:MAG: hypothetical protein ACI39U_03440 [Candidatus Cryptobacteroides sp.]